MRQIAATLELVHGQWDALARRPDRDVPRQVRAVLKQLQGKQPPEPVKDEIAMLTLNPRRELTTYSAIAALLRRGELSARQKLLRIGHQRLRSKLRSRFFVLTNRIVFGRRLGADVTGWSEQMAALRAMVDAQPNPRLLEGYPYPTSI